MPLFIEELGLTVPVATTSTANTEVKSISVLGELLRQPELLPQPIHPLDWSTYHNLQMSKRARI